MRVTLLGALFLCVFFVDVASSRCVDEVPHYAGQGYGPGRVIFSLFALPMTLGVSIMTVPVGSPDLTKRALCQPLYHAGAVKVAQERRK